MRKKRFTVVPAVYVILRDGNKILLIRRANTGYMDGMYGFPSGHVEGGEPAVAAAAREAKEEVGVDIDPSNLTLAHTLHRVAEEGDHERIDLCFEASSWRGELTNAEPHKCDAVEWHSIDDLPDNLIPVINTVLEQLAKGERYGHIGFGEWNKQG